MQAPYANAKAQHMMGGQARRIREARLNNNNSSSEKPAQDGCCDKKDCSYEEEE